MNETFHIHIEGLRNPQKFIEEWSKVYVYPNEEKYTNNINEGLDTDSSMLKLFEWKNGTGDVIYKSKFDRVKDFIGKRDELKKLSRNFNWEYYENLIEPQQGSVIWKVFLLHLIDPKEFPIYDQHVFRSFKFFTNGVIEDRPKSDQDYYKTYKYEYLEWFNRLKNEYDLEPRMMDKSFFSFGKMLKTISKTPMKIISEQ